MDNLESCVMHSTKKSHINYYITIPKLIKVHIQTQFELCNNSWPTWKVEWIGFRLFYSFA